MIPQILVAGIGNIFLGDDAFGCEVARRLMRADLPAYVRVEDFGIRSFDLAFALLDKPDRTIFIDAVPHGGKPGTLYKIAPDCANTGFDIEAHSMNPMSVLALAKALGDGELGEILIVGCEPENCDEGMGLSEAVAASIDAAVAMVKELVLEVKNESRNNPQRHGAGGGHLWNPREPA